MRSPILLVPLSVTLLLAGGCASQTADKPVKEDPKPSDAEGDAGAQPDAEEAEPQSEDDAEAVPPTADSGGTLELEMPAFEPHNADEDAHEMATNDVSGIGFRVSGLSKQGWSRSKAATGELMLSGPPGGPLGFEVRRYRSDQRGADLEDLFKVWTGQTPDASSNGSQVELAGAKRAAQAFRTGESLATTTTCIVDVPAAGADKGGLWVRFYIGASEGEAPSCAAVLKAPVFVPIVDSFAVVN